MDPHNEPESGPASPLGGLSLPFPNRMAIANLLSGPHTPHYIAMSRDTQPPNKMLNDKTTLDPAITSCHSDQSPPRFELTHSPPNSSTGHSSSATGTKLSEVDKRKIPQSIGPTTSPKRPILQMVNKQCLNCGIICASVSDTLHNCNASTPLLTVLGTKFDFVHFRIAILW